MIPGNSRRRRQSCCVNAWPAVAISGRKPPARDRRHTRSCDARLPRRTPAFRHSVPAPRLAIPHRVAAPPDRIFWFNRSCVNTPCVIRFRGHRQLPQRAQGAGASPSGSPVRSAADRDVPATGTSVPRRAGSRSSSASRRPRGRSAHRRPPLAFVHGWPSLPPFDNRGR